MIKDFENLPHTADIKIRVYGKTIKQLFVNALVGMFQSIGPKVKGCKKKGDRLICDQLPEQHEVEINSPDIDALLVDFLSEVLYLSDVHNEAYLDADIHDISETHLSATVHGIKVEGFDVVEIKAVTYNELKVKKIDGIWQSDIVFDI